MRPVRTLPTGWEGEIQRILNSVGEDWRDTSPPGAGLSRSAHEIESPGSLDFESQEELQRSQVAVQALKLGFQLALKERDAIIRQYEELGKVLQRSQPRFPMRPDPTPDSAEEGGPGPSAIPQSMATQLENLSMSSPKLNNRESELNSNQHFNSLLGDTSKPVPSPKFHTPLTMSEMFVEPVDEEEEERSTWEYHSVSLSRVSGYGFGIAVSGGRDNPHFKNGDPSIVVSDVLRSGPAWGQLIVNDRIVSANGIGLENADYITAVQIMKESDQMNLIVKRRVPMPAVEVEQRTLKFTLTKSKRRDDFGVQLGCKFFIRDITNPKLAEKEPGLKEGDVILKINGQNCEDLSFEEARRLLAKSKEKLSLVIQRDVPKGTTWRWPSSTTLYERLGSVADTPRDSPRGSPMPSHRFSDGEGQYRLNNNPSRTSGRYGRVGSVGEGVTSPKRHSGSQPPSRSRTPSHSIYDEYGNYVSQRGFPASTPPPCPTTPREEHPAFVGNIAHKPPLPLAQGDWRAVSFRKEAGSVGVRVIGGNEVGIFVSAVQAGSPAALKGVRPGDKIIEVNKKEMRGVTREEAVLFLLGLQDQVDLVLQYRKDEYERIRAQNLGDNFYIRVHFDHPKGEKEGELPLRRGDIFQITDTLFGGTVGSWQATRLSSPSNDPRSQPLKGVIPNAQRAEKLAANSDSSRMSRSQTVEQKGGTFLRRKMGLTRRAKSLNKNHWDEVVFSHGTVDFPAYERVKLKHPGFLRPVVLFGGLADVGRDLLLRDFPLRFAAATETSGGNSVESSSSGIIRLSTIKEVMTKNKHCVMDVTPSSVEKLQYAQYCPIVIFLNVDTRSRLKELRSKNPKTPTKSSKKLCEQASRIQKHYQHLFSATLDATKEEEWFEALRELISHLQERRVWMSESRPADLLDDDFLFPMGNSRYSTYVADSDIDSLKGDSELGSSLMSPPATGKIYAHGSQAGPSNSYEYNAPGHPGAFGSLGRPHAFPSFPAAQDPHYGTYLPTNNQLRRDNQWNGNMMEMPNFPQNLYVNRESMVSHFATIRRPPTNQNRPKPRPPPRPNLGPASCLPPVPPKPTIPPPPVPGTIPNDLRPDAAPRTIPNPPSFSVPPPPTTNPSASSQDSAQTSEPVEPETTVVPSSPARHGTNASLGDTSETRGQVGLNQAQQQQQALDPRLRQSYNRHMSEPGYFDVKQILAEQSEDYRRRTPSPRQSEYYVPQSSPMHPRPGLPPHAQPPRPPPAHYDHLGRPIYSPRAMAPRPGQVSMVRPRGGPQGPVRLMNPAFVEAEGGRPFLQPSHPPTSSPYQVPTALRINPVSRAASMPTATAPQLRNGRLPVNGIGELEPTRSPQPPPPAPAPRSPKPPVQSPKPISAEAATEHLAAAKDISVIRVPTQETYGQQQMVLPPPRRVIENGSTEEDGEGSGDWTEDGRSKNPDTPALTASSRSWPNGPGSEEGYGSSASHQGSPSSKKPPPLPQKPADLRGSGLDLTSRDEIGGSAFELYKKAEADQINGRLDSPDTAPTSPDSGESLSKVDSWEEGAGNRKVVARVSGRVGSEGGVLRSDETGVSIHIPPGALPVGEDQEIYFNVCRDNQMAPPMEFEAGEALLSPLVMCGPQGLKFQKPVELRLPHCASGINSEQWSFALKSASGAEAEWRQVTLADAAGQEQGKLDDRFVSVLIDHF